MGEFREDDLIPIPTTLWYKETFLSAIWRVELRETEVSIGQASYRKVVGNGITGCNFLICNKAIASLGVP